MTADQKDAVHALETELDRTITNPETITLSREIASTLRGLIDDLDTADQECTLAEKAYQQCDAKLKDALVEVENLRAWKHSMLTVESWWKKVDEAVRKHPSCKLGDTVAAAALRLIEERDALGSASIVGKLTNAGTMRVSDEEDQTGFFVSCTRDQIQSIKHLPMYRRVAIIPL